MAKTDDGKIRIRCTGCGKRVKFPAGVGGQTFRCPICKTTMVTPIGGVDADESSTEMNAVAVSEPKLPRERAYVRTKDAPASAPSEPAQKRLAEPVDPVEKLTRFLLRETQRTGHLSRQILQDYEAPVADQAARIRQLRNTKAVNFRGFAQALLKDLDDEIRELKESPAVDTPTVKQKLMRLLYDRRAALIFLNAMFEFKPVAASAATQETPGTGSAQPTKAQ